MAREYAKAARHGGNDVARRSGDDVKDSFMEIESREIKKPNKVRSTASMKRNRKIRKDATDNKKNVSRRRRDGRELNENDGG